MPFLIALALSALLVPSSIALGRVTGLVDRPGDLLKIHSRPVPVLGGLAVILAAWGACAAAGHIPGLGVSAALAILVVVGLIDSVRPVPAPARLAAQVAAGSALAAGGATLSPLGPFSGVATVLLLVACANATNMIDGQDGLAGGLVALAAFGVFLVLGGTGEERTLLLCAAGALCSFLLWNRPPARVFLGNSGPDALATILVSAVAAAGRAGGWPGLLGSATCLGVLLFELMFTFVRRCRQGRLMSGDRLHSYDLLAADGHSRAVVTFRFWAAGAGVAGLGAGVSSMSLAVGIPLDCAAAVAGALWGRQLWSRRRPDIGAVADASRVWDAQIESGRLIRVPAPPPSSS